MHSDQARQVLRDMFAAAIAAAQPAVTLAQHLPAPPRGRTIVTGPTLTNVNDFRAILISGT